MPSTDGTIGAEGGGVSREGGGAGGCIICTPGIGRAP